MKNFIESQFGYRPLPQMFCGRKANARVNDVYERALRVVYRNNNMNLRYGNGHPLIVTVSSVEVIYSTCDTLA